MEPRDFTDFHQITQSVILSEAKNLLRPLGNCNYLEGKSSHYFLVLILCNRVVWKKR